MIILDTGEWFSIDMFEADRQEYGWSQQLRAAEGLRPAAHLAPPVGIWQLFLLGIPRFEMVVSS